MTTPTVTFDPAADPYVIYNQKLGADAKRAELGPEECPFEEGTLLYNEWMEGYNNPEAWP